MHKGCHWSMGTVFCHSSVYEWMEKFKNGRTSFKCEEGGRPATGGRSAFMTCPQCKTFYFGGIKKIV